MWWETSAEITKFSSGSEGGEQRTLQRSLSSHRPTVLLSLPTELLVSAASNLDDVSLARLAEVCTHSRALLDGPDGDRLWADCARALWACKQRPADPDDSHACFGGGWKARYARALVDSRRRHLQPHELARAVWRFRFREDLEALRMPLWWSSIPRLANSPRPDLPSLTRSCRTSGQT